MIINESNSSDLDKPERPQRLESLRREIDIGLEQSAAGQTQVFDEKVVEEIEARGR